MKSEATAQREIRAIVKFDSHTELSKEETLFLGGALFALDWMMGKKSKAPSKYLPWLKEEAVRAQFNPMDVLADMINTEKEIQALRHHTR
jgi:hypothetical protein